jgi:hypothetical protein
MNIPAFGPVECLIATHVFRIAYILKYVIQEDKSILNPIHMIIIYSDKIMLIHVYFVQRTRGP